MTHWWSLISFAWLSVRHVAAGINVTYPFNIYIPDYHPAWSYGPGVNTWTVVYPGPMPETIAPDTYGVNGVSNHQVNATQKNGFSIGYFGRWLMLQMGVNPAFVDPESSEPAHVNLSVSFDSADFQEIERNASGPHFRTDGEWGAFVWDENYLSAGWGSHSAEIKFQDVVVSLQLGRIFTGMQTQA